MIKISDLGLNDIETCPLVLPPPPPPAVTLDSHSSYIGSFSLKGEGQYFEEGEEGRRKEMPL